jgi:putative lipoic acid-binding regulatory protein
MTSKEIEKAIAARKTVTDPVAFVQRYYPDLPGQAESPKLTSKEAYQLLSLAVEIAATEDQDVQVVYTRELEKAGEAVKDGEGWDLPHLTEQYGDALDYLRDIGTFALRYYLIKKKEEGKLSKSKTPRWCALYAALTGDECED